MFAAVEGDVEDRVPSSAQESRFEGISPFPRSSTDTLWLPSGAVPPSEASWRYDPRPIRQVTINIYVGNLPYQTDDRELEDLFAPFGDIASARVIMDRETGRSKGFGFVEMPDRAQGEAAIEALNGNEMDGRALRINEARPREERPRFGGGGGGGGGGYRGGGGGGRGGW